MAANALACYACVASPSSLPPFHPPSLLPSTDHHIHGFLARQVLDSLDAVIDVGGTYDPSTDRFDHHQKGFSHAFGHGFTTKLSSAGLVYKVGSLQGEKGSVRAVDKVAGSRDVGTVNVVVGGGDNVLSSTNMT